MKTDEEIKKECWEEWLENWKCKDPDWRFAIGVMQDIVIQKTRADLLAEIKGWLQEIRGSEDDSLNRMPIEISAKIQSGFLLGYADCWNKVLKRVVETEGKEAKQ